MKIASLRTPAQAPIPQRAASSEPKDVAQVGGSEPSWLGKVGRALLRIGKTAALVAAPAAATAIAGNLRGPNAAGLMLAGDMIGAGAYTAALWGQEEGPGQAFAAGAFLGLLSGAAGMIGPEGVAIMAALGGTGQLLSEILEATGG